MRGSAWIAAATLALGCGGGASEPPAAAAPQESETSTGETRPGDAPPEILEARIRPESPRAGDTLSVVLRAHDPERERLHHEVEWFRNGRSVQQRAGLELRVSDLQRGEEVGARVVVSDGVHEVIRDLDPVRIGNQPPVVTNVRLLPDRVTAEKPLLAQLDARDPDGDVYELEYAWYVNDRLLEGAREGSLEPEHFKRGDRVRVEVVARDRDEAGEPMMSAAVVVRNAVPHIDSEPVLSLEGGNRYRYRIVASDPDGDRPLRYELIQGPEGMSVDLVEGELLWTVPETVSGTVPIEVSVADAQGARATQSWTLEVGWEDEPAESASPEAAPERVPAAAPQP